MRRMRRRYWPRLQAIESNSNPVESARATDRVGDSHAMARLAGGSQHTGPPQPRRLPLVLRPNEILTVEVGLEGRTRR